MFHQILLLFLERWAICVNLLFQGQPPLRCASYGFGLRSTWSSLLSFRMMRCWGGSWGNVALEAEFVWLIWDGYIWKRQKFQGQEFIHNLEKKFSAFFLGWWRICGFLVAFQQKLGRFRMSEQKPCLLGNGWSFCQEDALIVYEGGLADEAQCTAPPGPVLVKVRTSEIFVEDDWVQQQTF